MRESDTVLFVAFLQEDSLVATWYQWYDIPFGVYIQYTRPTYVLHGLYQVPGMISYFPHKHFLYTALQQYTGTLYVLV